MIQPDDPDLHLDPRELSAQHRRRQQAAAEQSFSGALRRAIHAGPRDLPQLASASQIDLLELDDFLQGSAALTIGQFDRLAAVLGLRMLEVA